MSTQRYLIGELLRKGRANQASASRWDFSIDCGIDAEPRSVFYALTMPEYLETWLRPAGCRTVSVTQQASGYSIAFLSNDPLPVAVDASWGLCQPDQMVLNWFLAGNTSRVYIRLQPCAGRTILHLRHRGFASAQDSMWHGDLWTSSLERLTWFLEHAGAEGSSARARIRAISALHRSVRPDCGSFLSQAGSIQSAEPAHRAAGASSSVAKGEEIVMNGNLPKECRMGAQITAP